ncbi:MAG: phosphoenolpyruvate synthase [Candidatus Melainabacteria bacterium HGW-Melainabacteria-1]|nr:MAG: phosphoenolpyruvate synthase [Candidatus Melainabacteria bacterium HGW-Melainabacteria-1]
MSLSWGSKAETLASLRGRLQYGDLLPQIQFTRQDWALDCEAVIARIGAEDWLARPLVVRSSALNEDDSRQSLAGHYESILDVLGKEALQQAIERVIASFDDEENHQVFVQPQVTDIRLSGVAFSRDPNTGSPYLVINYDDHSGRSDSVTSGISNSLRTFYHHHEAGFAPPAPLDRIQALMNELVACFEQAALDIEFAIDAQARLWLLQVRPLVIPPSVEQDEQLLNQALHGIARRFGELSRPHPYLKGERTVFGVMPDWNPAEIVGVRPGPLSLSMYQELVTDAIWAYQRHNYGYRNLRSFPLLQSFAGSPFIDVRLSFNSFLPATLPDELASRLAQYYINRLLAFPSFHDKVEFEIIFSCYTLDLPERLGILRKHSFSEDDCHLIADSLRGLTNAIVHTESGLWKQDIAKIQLLEQRQLTLAEADLDLVSRIYWLLEDAKRYGTLPFAGLARAGFIAVQMLRSLVRTGVLSQQEHQQFMANLETVSSRIGRDLADLSQSAFLRKYGHLRPGTYDLLSPRYDEAPARYFDWNTPFESPPEPQPFVLSLRQLKAIENLLRKHQLEHNLIELFDFLKEAIEGREFAKFVFTKNLSEALRLFGNLALSCGLSLEQAALCDIACIQTLYTTSRSPAEVLRESAAAGARQASLTRQLVLPPLLTSERDIWSFELDQGEPNYITLKSAIAPLVTSTSSHDQLKGAILIIESADPGFDWVFSHGIAGLITQYGGANSHMAIRAGELGIPAVIGAGEVLYQRWSRARMLELDCANRQVRVLS